MKRELLEVFVCPASRSRLSISGAGSAESDEIIEGELVSEAGAHYEVRRGVPIFLPSSSLSEAEQETQAEYDASAEQKYDAAVDWLFQSFYENEDNLREQMIDLLHLTPAARVLEIGSGTGRDSFRIARNLANRASSLFRTFQSKWYSRRVKDLKSRRRNWGSLQRSTTLSPQPGFYLSQTPSLMPSSISVALTTSVSQRRRLQK
jgi:uncharacterized protein YbaR (Trm112 family)